MTIKRCPICSGPIADWAIRSEFSCHHCHWALSAGVRRASAWAVAGAASLELAAFGALWFLKGSASGALDVYLPVFGTAGALAWTVCFHFGLRLTPIRPQRGRAALIKAPAAGPA